MPSETRHRRYEDAEPPDDDADGYLQEEGPNDSSSKGGDTVHTSDKEDEDALQPRPPRVRREYTSPSPVPDEDEDAPSRLSRYDKAVNSRKHDRSPTPDDQDKDKGVPLQKIQKVTDFQGRARLQDYDYEDKEIIATALELYEVKLVTVNPFPDAVQQDIFSDEAWNGSCERHQIAVRPSSDIIKMVCRHLILVAVGGFANVSLVSLSA